MGFKTIAISTSESKKDISLKLGADIFIDESTQDANVELQKLGGAHMIITTAPKAEAVVNILGGLAFEGKLVVLSLPLDSAAFMPSQSSILILSRTRNVTDSAISQVLFLPSVYPSMATSLAQHRTVTTQFSSHRSTTSR